ncbi:hypothetical protein [Catellatospora sichuanensis]|uniref:hypothetical protein n=1 Tax=Catellatospora sichuanensis TaxID=1969805 RepID=UPI00118343CB|nr:hypothetical protein [Catellatospora sichuanensis]
MGFWGTFVVHRDQRLLADLLPDVAAEADLGLCYDGVSGGWQVTRVHAGYDELPPGFLAELRDLTAAPVLAADVMDSDAALVTALGLDAPGWQAWLQLDGAIGHLEPPPSPFTEDGTYLGDGWCDPDYERHADEVRARILAETPGGTVAAAAAIGWAHEAGLQPGTLEDVTAALQGHEVFVEDLFYLLINRLGIATDEVELPERLSVHEHLLGLLGRKLTAIAVTAHQPVRGEQLVFDDMFDICLCFEGAPTVTACACGGEFSLARQPDDDRTGICEQHGDASTPQALAAAVGRQLTDAAVISGRYVPTHAGVVLRFGDQDCFIAAIDGQWTVVEGSTPPPELMEAIGPDRHNELHIRSWLAD